MKCALVFTFAIIAVHGGSFRVRRQGGWGAGWSSTTTTLPPTTTGWSPPETTTTTAAPTTVGWSPPETTVGWGVPTTAAPETTTTSAPETTAPPPTGWPAPPPPPTNAPGWGPPIPLPPLPVLSSGSVTIEGELAALGSGWAASNHGENIQATGGAAVAVSSAGESVVDQNGLILQLANVDSTGASGLQSISVEQLAEGAEGVAVLATGLSASVGSNGWSGAAGQALSSASGSESVVVIA